MSQFEKMSFDEIFEYYYKLRKEILFNDTDLNNCLRFGKLKKKNFNDVQLENYDLSISDSLNDLYTNLYNEKYLRDKMEYEKKQKELISDLIAVKSYIYENLINKK